MNKILRAVVALLAAVLFASFAGCGGGGGGGAKAEDNFVGVWTIHSTQIDGETMEAEALNEMFEMLGMNVEDMFKLEFKEDGNFSLAFEFGEDSEAFDGTWKAKDANTVEMTAEGNTITATLSDGLLTLDQDGSTMVFKKVDKK